MTARSRARWRIKFYHAFALPHMVGQSDEAGIARRLGKSRGKPSQHHACVERLEMRAVIQHQDGHDLAVSQPRLWSALLGRLRALPQQQCLPVRAKCLAKIIELTETPHEPVEHGRLPTSDGADSRRGIQRRQEVSLTSNP